ncbi:MAG: hypothetical protein WCF18_17240, partial [Chthoniobacteraceae bacterium]
DTTTSLGIYPNFGSNSLVFNNFAVNVGASPLPTTYANWAAQIFLGAPGADSSPTADPDQDGVNNRLEYALRRNSLGSEGGPLKQTIAANGEKRLEFTWNSHATDLGYQLIGGSDLATSASWPPLNFDVVGQQVEGDTWRVTIRPVGITGNRYFFRLRINQTAP